MAKLIEPHIQEFFKIQELLGSGAYGHVWRVIQKSTGKQFALKKIFDAFQNNIDAQRTYRQITVLNQLKHPNIVKLKAVIHSKNKKDMYLVFQYEQADLHALVGEKILQTPHLIYIIYQIFKALKYLHSAQLLHRDLKPSNILINAQCQIKLCDFGLVRSLTRQEDSQLNLTEDVATRWYRSPQMLMGSKNYGSATDVWSVGCIIAQLLIGEPIFPGSSNVNQIERIMQFTGTPSKEDLQSLQVEYAQSLVSQLQVNKKSSKHYFKDCEPILVDLVIKMLQFNPSKRMTVNQLLEHELMTQIRSKRQQIICLKMILPQVDDNTRLTLEEYQKIIYRDIERRYPQYNKIQQQDIHDNRRLLRGHNSLKIVKNMEKLNGSIVGRTGSTSLFRPKEKLVSTWAPNNNNIKNNQKSIANQLSCYINPPKSKISQHSNVLSNSIHQNITPFKRYKKYRQPHANNIQNIQKTKQQISKQNNFSPKFVSILRNNQSETIYEARPNKHTSHGKRIQRKTFNRQKKTEIEQKRRQLFNKRQVAKNDMEQKNTQNKQTLLQPTTEF